MDDYQNDFANDLSTSGYGQKPKRGWFARNWLWFVPTVILLPLCCCCGGPIGLIWWGVGEVLDIAPYKDSIALAEQDTQVQNQLGTPIDTPENFINLITTLQQNSKFNFNQINNIIQFNTKIPLNKPKDSSTLYVKTKNLNSIN